MSYIAHEIRKGAYYDSVVLMQLQKGLAGLDGVEDAGIVMATPANFDLLQVSDLLPETAKTAKPDDLLIVVKADDETTANHALSQVDVLLKARRSSGNTQGFRPRSLKNATTMLDAGWVLISLPGRFAAGVAEEALDLGKHVFLYSDNVSLADEVELKQKACDKGLLVMGPDCGTAIVNGVGLGFANRVRQGNIGIVAASGTGLQAVSVAIDGLNAGISQAIGTGGRDLKAEVGGITALQALELLQGDDQTKVITIISKPPAPAVATKLLAQAQATNKPVVVYFMGYPPPARQMGNIHFALNLNDTAQLAVELADSLDTAPTVHNPTTIAKGNYVRGLFSGGTLAYETVLGIQSFLLPLHTNTSLHEHQRLADPFHSQAHTIVDMGADDFTQGRLHPMMDNDLRLRRLAQEAEDPNVGLILLDVVLGEGSHGDPAVELVGTIAQITPQKDVAVLLVGTSEDPQNIEAQAEQFLAAGATVFYTVNDMVAMVRRLFQPVLENEYPAIDGRVLEGDFAGINLGLETFHDSIIAQGGETIQVEWKPPAGGNEKMMALLAKLKSR